MVSSRRAPSLELCIREYPCWIRILRHDLFVSHFSGLITSPYVPADSGIFGNSLGRCRAHWSSYEGTRYMSIRSTINNHQRIAGLKRILHMRNASRPEVLRTRNRSRGLNMHRAQLQ